MLFKISRIIERKKTAPNTVFLKHNHCFETPVRDEIFEWLIQKHICSAILKRCSDDLNFSLDFSSDKRKPENRCMDNRISTVVIISN